MVIYWLLTYIKDKLDLRQYGGTKGKSVNHYLINFINFILYNQDMKQAVIAINADFSKGFNRINHYIILEFFGATRL